MLSRLGRSVTQDLPIGVEDNAVSADVDLRGLDVRTEMCLVRDLWISQVILQGSVTAISGMRSIPGPVDEEHARCVKNHQDHAW